MLYGFEAAKFLVHQCYVFNGYNFQLRESSKLLELDYDFDSLTRKRPLSAGTDFIRGEMGISSYLKIAF